MFWTIFPLSRLRQRTRSERPSSRAVVNQILSDWITGEDQPSPGMAVFHAIFFDSLQKIGRPFSLECPCPSGPRNSGQSSASPSLARRQMDSRSSPNIVLPRNRVFHFIGVPTKLCRIMQIVPGWFVCCSGVALRGFPCHPSRGHPLPWERGRGSFASAKFKYLFRNGAPTLTSAPTARRILYYPSMCSQRRISNAPRW